MGFWLGGFVGLACVLLYCVYILNIPRPKRTGYNGGAEFAGLIVAASIIVGYSIPAFIVGGLVGRVIEKIM